MNLKNIAVVTALSIAAALASFTIQLTVQEQQVSAFNDNNDFVFNSHSHTKCGTEIGSCTDNDGRVSNDEDTHCNDNFNSNRPEPQKFHCNDKPDNDK
jgi:hypothetical protein